MDILSHTFSGVAIGTVCSSYAANNWKDQSKIILISALGGAVPDFDAISLWSKFDATIGKVFHLPYSGKYIYSAKLWYSHHGFLHSIAGCLFMTTMLGLSLFLFSYFRKTNTWNIHTLKLPLAGFMCGFLLHLIEDMPTPAASWGGVNLFWPSKGYIGGSGDIWWWNNYDIFLIILSIISINIIALLVFKWKRFSITRFTWAVFVIGVALSFYQIKHRGFDFAYSGHAVNYELYELKSKDIQKQLLGKKVFSMMEKLDRMLPVYF
ncbi:MAG: metal-dependent hydrolase [Cytophagaceae bacterium]